MMSFQDFIDKYDGKRIDYDGAYGAQCFDLYRLYCQDVLEVPQSLSTGSAGAVKIWDTYLSQYFDRIDNTPEGVPQRGDIVIWNKEIGPYGHVAVFIEGDANKFKSFDQNFPEGSPCHIQEHSYKGVLGWLRMKKHDGIIEKYTEEQMTSVRLERDNNWNLYQKTLSQLQVQKEAYSALESRFQETQALLESSQAQVKALREELSSRQNEAIHPPAPPASEEVKPQNTSLFVKIIEGIVLWLKSLR